MSIALYHFHVTQIKRGAGQSAIASAAYRSGEKLHSEYYGEDSDYTKKGGVIYSEILLPSYAPSSFSDRETLWNEVEKSERGKKAQLAYSFDIALQNEFSMQENIELARQFLLEQFVSRGMVVDFAVHSPDKEDGGISNPHFHVMCPIRPLDEHGRWATNSGGNICLMSMATASVMKQETMCSTLYQPPIGAVPIPWSIGGKHGLISVIKSLRKKNWTAGLTTAVMSDRASTNSPPSMRV